MTKNVENIVDNYFQNIIKNSWTWNKLTEEEKKRFTSLYVFQEIKGSKDTVEQWFFTIYAGFLAGLGYNGTKWREF